LLRFSYSNPKTLERIIRSLDLVALDARARAQIRITYLGEDDTKAHWWAAEEISSTPKVYVARHMGEALSKPPSGRRPIGSMTIPWIDEVRNTAYLAYHTF
jgi:hypothetical protein